MIMTREEWWKKAIEKGTSGDMVTDILGDWEEERRKFLFDVSTLEEKMKELEEELYKMRERK